MTTESPAGIMRAARTQLGQEVVAIRDYHAERMSFILRIYLADPASVRGGVVLTFPSFPDPGIPGYSPNPAAALVTALEEPEITRPAMTVSRVTAPGDPPSYPVQLSPDRALTTVRITVTRWPTQPGDGK